MQRKSVTAFLIFILLGATVASVGALWNQDTSAELPAVGYSPFESQSREQWLLSLDSRQSALWERLEKRLSVNAEDHEASLLKSLLYFQTAQLDAALNELQTLTRRAPKFQLAHLILGDLLLARFDQLEQIGASPVLDTLKTPDEKRIEQLRNEAKARLQGYLALIEQSQIPRALISLSDAVDHVLIVDKSKNRIYIYENAGTGLPPQLIDDYYIVLGKKRGNKFIKGDLKTPSGVYFVTHFIDDNDLPRKYGTGAFPVNYPNEYDRRLSKSGDGIWLHGTDKELYSRPPLDSEGCVVLTNSEFTRIRDYVTPGKTPVIISEQVEWISSDKWLERNIELQAKLESWRKNWEKADIGAYLDNYSVNFWSKKHNYDSWRRYKRRVLANKKSQKITLSEISLFAYPRQSINGQEVVVANFKQRYRSNNYNGDMRKRLYLTHENGDWRVLYEGRQ